MCQGADFVVGLDAGFHQSSQQAEAAKETSANTVMRPGRGTNVVVASVVDFLSRDGTRMSQASFAGYRRSRMVADVPSSSAFMVV